MPVKVILDKGSTINVYEFPREENLKSCLLRRLKSRWKKMRFQLALNKTSCSNPQPLTHRQEQKLTRQCFLPLSLPPHRFSTQILQCQTWNAKKYSILTVNELGLPILEPSARISKFYAPTDSEHKFNKTEIENWLPIGYNLGSSWLGTRSHNRYTMFIR